MVADALDEVAVSCSPHRDLAVNPAKILAIGIADANPMVWGGTVLAARAGRRIAESIRRATGARRWPPTPSTCCRCCAATAPADVFADPFADGGAERRPALVVLDDGRRDPAVPETRDRLDGDRAGRTASASRRSPRGRTGDVARYAAMLSTGTYAAAYLRVGLGRTGRPSGQPWIRRLANPVQRYAWGSVEAIPRLLGVPPDGEPQAEIWLGRRPPPAKVQGAEGPVSDSGRRGHPIGNAMLGEDQRWENEDADLARRWRRSPTDVDECCGSLQGQRIATHDDEKYAERSEEEGPRDRYPNLEHRDQPDDVAGRARGVLVKFRWRIPSRTGTTVRTRTCCGRKRTREWWPADRAWPSRSTLNRVEARGQLDELAGADHVDVEASNATRSSSCGRRGLESAPAEEHHRPRCCTSTTLCTRRRWPCRQRDAEIGEEVRDMFVSRRPATDAGRGAQRQRDRVRGPPRWLDQRLRATAERSG